MSIWRLQKSLILSNSNRVWGKKLFWCNWFVFPYSSLRRKEQIYSCDASKTSIAVELYCIWEEIVMEKVLKLLVTLAAYIVLTCLLNLVFVLFVSLISYCIACVLLQLLVSSSFLFEFWLFLIGKGKEILYNLDFPSRICFVWISRYRTQFTHSINPIHMGNLSFLVAVGVIFFFLRMLRPLFGAEHKIATY